MSYLIEKDGERVWAPSLNGYEGWTILRQGIGTKPPENAELIDGNWVVNQSFKTAAERRTKFENMSKEQVVDFLLNIIKKGDARLDALEARVTKLEPPIPSVG